MTTNGNDSWNPEEIPEDADNAMMIPGTVYSKCWLIRILKKLAKFLGLEVPDENDLDVEDMESELCDLWDASVNGSVAEILVNMNALDMFVHFALYPECISSVSSGRIAELCLGILANVCCFEEFRNQLNPNLPKLLSLHDQTQDAQLLAQLYRLIYSLHITDRQLLTDFLRKHVLFTLCNCLNEALLEQCCSLFEWILEQLDDQIPNDLHLEIVHSAQVALKTLDWKVDPSSCILNGLLCLCPTMAPNVRLSSIVLNGIDDQQQEKLDLAMAFFEALCSKNPEVLDYNVLVEKIMKKNNVNTIPSLIRVVISRPDLMRSMDIQQKEKMVDFVTTTLNESLGIDVKKSKVNC